MLPVMIAQKTLLFRRRRGSVSASVMLRCSRSPNTPSRLRLDDGYDIKDAWAAPVEPDEQSPVDQTQTQQTTRGALLQDV